MKLICSALLLLLISVTCRAQETKSQKEFIASLNQLATGTQQYHWDYGDTMRVDSAFHLIGDTLSITWSWAREGTTMRRRIAAPFSKIERVIWDFYLCLDFGNNFVANIFEQSAPGEPWKKFDQYSVMHIGLVSGKIKKEMKMKEEIEKSFVRLTK